MLAITNSKEKHRTQYNKKKTKLIEIIHLHLKHIFTKIK